MNKRFFLFVFSILLTTFSLLLSPPSAEAIAFPMWEKVSDQNQKYDDKILSSVLSNDGIYIYLVGYESVDQTNIKWRIERRFTNNGELDATFNTSFLLPQGQYARATSIAKDISGNFYVAGIGTTSDDVGGVLAVYHFDSSGNSLQIENVSIGIYPITEPQIVFKDYLHVVYGQNWGTSVCNATTGDTFCSYYLKYRKSDKTRQYDAQLTNFKPYALTADDTYLYAGGLGDPLSTDQQWRIEKRDLDGNPVDFKQREWNPTAIKTRTDNFDAITAIAVNDTGIYGGGMVNGAQEWRIEKRNNDNTGAQNANFIPIVTPSAFTGLNLAKIASIKKDPNDSTKIYVARRYSRSVDSPTYVFWIAEAINSANGNIIWRHEVSDQYNQMRNEMENMAITDTNPPSIFLIGGHQMISFGTNFGWRVDKLSQSLAASDLIRAKHVNALVAEANRLLEGYGRDKLTLSVSSGDVVKKSDIITINDGLNQWFGNGCLSVDGVGSGNPISVKDFNTLSTAINTKATCTKYVFLTSTIYDGNLGGISGADAKCQARANTFNLGGTWKAWISDSNTNNDPESRFN